MKHNNISFLSLFALLFIGNFSAYSYASSSVIDLINNDKLKVELFLSVAGQKSRSVKLTRPAIVNEQIDLIVKISTDRWFTRGTRIVPLNLNGALVQQRDKLASNYTERIDGQTWSVQEWQLAIYPVEAGRFAIPYLTLATSVSLEEGGSAEGVMQTPSLEFDVITAATAQDRAAEFSATQVELTQRWSSTSDLKVGDAVERTLFIDADETTISLLPVFELAKLAGTKGYSEVIYSKDIQHRGQYSAQKKITHTYLIQKSGQLQIPEIVMSWWNTEAGKMQQITLLALDVNITHTPQSWLKQYWLHLLSGFSLLGIVVMLMRQFRTRYQTEKLPTVVFFVRQLLANNWGQANRHLYNRNSDKNGQVVLRGKVAKEDVDAWSEQHFSPAIGDKKSKIITLLKMWLTINR